MSAMIPAPAHVEPPEPERPAADAAAGVVRPARRVARRAASPNGPPIARSAAALVLVALAGCGGGGGGGGGGGDGGGGDGGGGGGGDRPRDDGPPESGINGTHLYLSMPRVYFSTRDVGTDRTEQLEIQNRGADAYALGSIAVAGPDMDDFRVRPYPEVMLQPAQALRVPITFAPIAEGRKYADLEIDYDTVTLATPEENALEATYYRARDRAADGEYAAARRTWGEYLDSDPVTPNVRRAAVRMPVAKEAEDYGQGRDATLYLEALDARDRDAPGDALDALGALLDEHGDGYLADDALYLRGYVQLMDLDAPEAALRELGALAERHPDSTYRDTALYAEAIAQERLGNDRLAVELYERLRERHTGIDALGVRLPKDELTSRLWFARATQALETLGAA